MMIFVRRNFGYKLVSVMIAVLLYFIANNQLNPHTSNEVYILPDVVGLPDDEVIRTAPAGFTLTVAGATAAVNVYKAQTVKASVDVSGARIGTNKLPILYKLPQSGDIDVSGGPPYAEVTLESKARHEWFVDVINENDPPPGYVYGETPQIKVKVSGLPSEVSRVARVVAAVPKTTGLGEIDEEVTLIPQTESKQTVDTVQVEPAKAEVHIPLKPESSSKTVVLSASLQGQPAEGYMVSGYVFSPPQVTVNGSRETLATLPALSVRVDITGLSKSVDKRVPLLMPPGLALGQTGIPTVKLHIEVRPTGSSPSQPGASAKLPSGVPQAPASIGSEAAPAPIGGSPAPPAATPLAPVSKP